MKAEKFFGWRLHLIVTPDGIPVSFDLLPASFHDSTPLHELMEWQPTGATVYADKGYNSADDEAWIEGRLAFASRHDDARTWSRTRWRRRSACSGIGAGWRR